MAPKTWHPPTSNINFTTWQPPYVIPPYIATTLPLDTSTSIYRYHLILHIRGRAAGVPADNLTWFHKHGCRPNKLADT